MELSSTRIVEASQDVVWQALNDPAVLKECIPGCESLTRESDSEWRAVVATRIGPVSAKFTGRITLADVVPPTSYTLKFDGQGGGAGFANGQAQVSLAPAPANAAATALSYSAKAQVGGKLAQIGSRLIDGAAAKMADDFFARFAQRFAAAAPSEPAVPVPQPPGPPVPRGNTRWIRYAALAAIAVLIAYLAMRGFHF